MKSIKTSGKTQEFETGAHRDNREGKGRFDLIPTMALKRLAVHYERGADLYGEDNWKKGMPLRRLLDSAIRHIFQCLEGKEDEDHAAAALWNVCGFMYTKDAIADGVLPEKLDDLPRYETHKVDDGEILKLEKELHPFKTEIHTDGRTVRTSHDPSGHSVTKFQSSDQRCNYFSALKELKEILDHTGEVKEKPTVKSAVREEDFDFEDGEKVFHYKHELGRNGQP
jgi:hypothetical protein